MFTFVNIYWPLTREGQGRAEQGCTKRHTVAQRTILYQGASEIRPLCRDDLNVRSWVGPCCTFSRTIEIFYQLHLSNYYYYYLISNRSETYLRGKSVRSWYDGSSDRSFMVDPYSYFSFQPVLHNWCNKGRGMCYPVCGMMHIKEPLLLIGKSSPYGGSGFPLSLSEWYFTICLTLYNRK